MADPLRFAARHAKWILVLGLVLGAVLPRVASTLSDWLVFLIILVMFLGAFRIPQKNMGLIWQTPVATVLQVLVLQLIVPIICLFGFALAGQLDNIGALAIVLTLSAPAIVSSPNIAGIMGLDSAASIRLVIWSTMLVPLTSLPIFAVIFGVGAQSGVFEAALRLAVIILLAGGLGLLCRRALDKQLNATWIDRVDGVSAIALGVFVIALMPALRGTFEDDPLSLAGWVLLAFAISFGAQVLVLWMAGSTVEKRPLGSLALISGNRNLALFFAALPAERTDVFLAFLAAYQIPMYLTPLLMNGVYRKKLD